MKSPVLCLNIEACSTATATCRKGVVDNLELRPNQFLSKVHLTPLQQLQGGRVEYNFGSFQPNYCIPSHVLICRKHKYCIIRPEYRSGTRRPFFLFLLFLQLTERFDRRDLRGECHQLHNVLEAVATAAFDLDSQGELGVGILGHDLGEALGRKGRGVSWCPFFKRNF